VGAEATREAVRRLLEEALAIERAAEQTPLPEPFAGVLTAAIMLLTVDLQHPATAEDLSIRTLAYRELAERGHPRIADNARWRLYDHVRATLEGATAAAPSHRMDVAVQALYAGQENVEPWLAESPPHARPPWPSPTDLWTHLERARTALSEHPNWSSVVSARERDDAELRDTVMTVLPAPRDPTWGMPALPRGTGRSESLAPVIVVAAERALVDAGRPGASTVPLGDDVEPLSHALQGALAADGRGTFLLAADPMLPSPQLRSVLRGVRRAQATQMELAVREPRSNGEGGVVVALPVQIGRSSEATAGVQALLSARIHVHLTGPGVRFAVDNRWLGLAPTTGRALAEAVSALARAYPRERIVRITLTPDVAYGQLVELVAALEGGEKPRFVAVGWWAGGAPPAGEPRLANDLAFKHRLAWAWADPRIALDQPYPLQESDQERLEAFAEALAACLPELELPAPSPARLVIDLKFADGRLKEVTPKVPGARVRANKAGIAAVSTCIRELGYGVRLRAHKDEVTVGLTLHER
jgi:hypothetical protein